MAGRVSHGMAPSNFCLDCLQNLRQTHRCRVRVSNQGFSLLSESLNARASYGPLSCNPLPSKFTVLFCCYQCQMKNFFFYKLGGKAVTFQTKDYVRPMNFFFTFGHFESVKENKHVCFRFVSSG